MGHSLVDVYKDVEEIRKTSSDLVKVSDVVAELSESGGVFKKVRTCGLIVSKLPEFLSRKDGDGEIFCRVKLDDGLDSIYLDVKFKDMDDVLYGTYVKVLIMGYRSMLDSKGTLIDKENFYVSDIEVIGKYEKTKPDKKESSKKKVD